MPGIGRLVVFLLAMKETVEERNLIQAQKRLIWLNASPKYKINVLILSLKQFRHHSSYGAICPR